MTTPTPAAPPPFPARMNALLRRAARRGSAPTPESVTEDAAAVAAQLDDAARARFAADLVDAIEAATTEEATR